MSILRTGILVAVIVAVLPADKEQQARLFERATSAMHWTATFCDRNGPTCQQAGYVWSGFIEKAKFGAGMAYELATKQSASSNTSLLAPAATDPVWQGTLKPEDLEPTWRGGPSRSGV
jgi:hypothetical protein